MKIFRIGSCRIFDIPNSFDGDHEFINSPIGYTHTIKEHIQLIKHLRGELKIPSELLQYIYTFYGGDQRKENIEDIFLRNTEDINIADIFLVEISSLKIIEFSDLFFQISRFKWHYKWNIPTPGTDLLSNCREYVQQEEDFNRDFHKLSTMLRTKPIIYTGQINIKTEKNEYLPNRRLINSLVSRNSAISGNYYYDLSKPIESAPSKYIENDLVHLKDNAFNLARDYIEQMINRMQPKA